MERALVLQILDAAWKDHLLVMDHLRSSVGLRGYAQVDPKVEYKREGMRTFETMWDSVGERVTDLIFRMEQLDEGFVGSTWTEPEAIHQEAPAATEIVAAAAGRDRRNPGRPQAGADPQPAAAGRAQRPLPLRQRQEVQGLLHGRRKLTRDVARRFVANAGKGFPTCPICSNARLSGADSLFALPWLAWQAIRKGKYREGFAEKFLGLRPAPRGGRRAALPLAARGQRGRGEPARARCSARSRGSSPTGSASSPRRP